MYYVLINKSLKTVCCKEMELLNKLTMNMLPPFHDVQLKKIVCVA